jgi:hypothetical protein
MPLAATPEASRHHDGGVGSSDRPVNRRQSRRIPPPFRQVGHGRPQKLVCLAPIPASGGAILTLGGNLLRCHLAQYLAQRLTGDHPTGFRDLTNEPVTAAISPGKVGCGPDHDGHASAELTPELASGCGEIGLRRGPTGGPGCQTDEVDVAVRPRLAPRLTSE